MGAVGQLAQSGNTIGRRLALPALAVMARPRVAALVALVAYLLRSRFYATGSRPSATAYFNYLADAFLHGRLSLLLPGDGGIDVVQFAGHQYLYSPPFPALLISPLIALFGVTLSDALYTATLGALSVGLLARLLAVLDRRGIAPLSAERRGILVTALAFGSVLLILAPVGTVWFTAQIVGWGCVLLATLAALDVGGRRGYLLAGLALGCAAATRNGLLFNGLWLAFFMLRRDWHRPWRWRAGAALCGLAPVAAAVLLLLSYNWARFDHPLQMGLPWHSMNGTFRADYERYGVFNPHYLPTNLWYQFVAYTPFTADRWKGGGLFWMTPILLGAPYAIWALRRAALTWALVLSGALTYVPVGLVMGTGYVTFGPRYLLDLMVPIVVLTAMGIRAWNVHVLRILLLIGCATYLFGSLLWLFFWGQ